MPTDALYHRPTTLDAAIAVLADGAHRIAAGCTDLFPLTEGKVLEGPVLDITAIPGLRGITQTEAGLRIGATTTWSDIARAELPPALDGLKLAAVEVGAQQIQNRGTIAGNLCNASPAADGVPPLLTLDAQVELTGPKGLRQLPLQAFITGPRRTALMDREIVTAILVPASALAGQGQFLKLGARRYLVISIAMTAARITTAQGRVSEAALAIGSCGPVATRLPDIEATMIGQPLSADLIRDDQVARAISPIADMRADAEYRSKSAAELLRRTIHRLLEQQGGTP